jgi:hypothetical protein
LVWARPRASENLASPGLALSSKNIEILLLRLFNKHPLYKPRGVVEASLAFFVECHIEFAGQACEAQCEPGGHVPLNKLILLLSPSRKLAQFCSTRVFVNVTNPATGELFGPIPMSPEADVGAAVNLDSHRKESPLF